MYFSVPLGTEIYEIKKNTKTVNSINTVIIFLYDNLEIVS